MIIYPQEIRTNWSGTLTSESSITVTADGTASSELRYTAYGEERYTSGQTPTDYRYTGQLSKMETTGLYYYGARWYDPAIGRFIQPDTIVPGPGNPLDWDRYAYARYNPIKYIDPTGHFTDEAIQNYLKENYGDNWSETWKSWLKDKDWMAMLHGAKAGDVLSRITYDSNGSPMLTHYTIMGKSDQELYGLYGEKAPDLNSVYSSSGGIGIVRFEEGNLSVIGEKGNIDIRVHKRSDLEVGFNYVLMYGSIGATGFIPGPGWIFPLLSFTGGLGMGLTQTFDPNNPIFWGMTPGDTDFNVMTYATGVDIMWGIKESTLYSWEFRIRNGVFMNNAYPNRSTRPNNALP